MKEAKAKQNLTTNLPTSPLTLVFLVYDILNIIKAEPASFSIYLQCVITKAIFKFSRQSINKRSLMH